MRVLHIIRTLDPKTGGPASAVRGMAAAQAEMGHQVTVLFEDASEWTVLVRGPSLPPAPAVQSINLAAAEAASLDDELARLEPDIVHLHGVWCALIRRALRALALHQIPYVLAPHGALGRWSMKQKPLRKRAALALLYRRWLRRATALVASSESERADLVELGFDANVELVPHGVSAEDIVQADVARAVEPTILFLGRLAEVKDPLLLVDAFELVARKNEAVRLVVAGPDDGLGAALFERMRRLPAPIAARVILAGPIAGRAKYRALRSAWVLCLPSRYESFGLVLVEAMAQGTPIVCSIECGFSDAARVGAGTMVPRDEAELARAIELYLVPEQRDRAGDRGRALVLERYLWSSVALEYARIYARSGLPMPPPNAIPSG